MKTNFTDEEIKLMLEIIYILEAPLPMINDIKQKMAECIDIPLSDINELCAKVKLFFDNQLED
jgi:hypothetical protein